MKSVYFWGIVGTLNAVITPSTGGRFSALAVSFNILLCMAVSSLACCLRRGGLRMRPTLKGLLRSFLLANFYMVGYRRRQSAAEI